LKFEVNIILQTNNYCGLRSAYLTGIEFKIKGINIVLIIAFDERKKTYNNQEILEQNES
jgi:hypothetical protein